MAVVLVALQAVAVLDTLLDLLLRVLFLKIIK